MSNIYTYFKSEYSNGTFIWDKSNDVKVLLITTGYNFDPDQHYADSISGYEINGTNYINGFGNSGRKSITSRTIYTDIVTDRVYFRGDNISWTELDAGVIGGVILLMESGGSDSNSLLIAHLESGGLPLLTNGNNINLNWDALGIFRI